MTGPVRFLTRLQCGVKNSVLCLVISMLAACGGGSGGGDNPPIVGPQSGASFTQPVCGGTRVWDFGASEEIQGAVSLVSESAGAGDINSRFPCIVLWEYVPSAGCSLLFTYEGAAQFFNNDPDIVSQIVVSAGGDLVAVGSNGAELTAGPANISVTELSNLPDCVLQ